MPAKLIGFVYVSLPSMELVYEHSSFMTFAENFIETAHSGVGPIWKCCVTLDTSRRGLARPVTSLGHQEGRRVF